MTNEETINPIPEETSEGIHNAETPETTESSTALNQELSPAATNAELIVEEKVLPVETQFQQGETPVIATETPAQTVTPVTPPHRKREKPQKPKLSEEEFAPIWEELTKAKDTEVVLDVKCTKAIRGGALVEYHGVEGFIPMSHFDLSKNTSEKMIEPHVGQIVNAIVIELSPREERRFVGSRKSALKKLKFDTLKKGMVVEGTVTSITDYGVFVDLGGIDGLVHISRLSKVRVNHPSDIVKPKQNVKVSVVDVDYKKERIALSMREFTESPWTRVAEKYPVGSIQKGKVRNITGFGVYVQLEPGVDGMIHISDLSWTKRLITPDEVVKVGQEVTAKVMEVNAERQRIALSLKDTYPDPWPKLANIYPVGTESEAKIKQLTQAGAVVELPLDVDGFVPRGKMGLMKKKSGNKKDIPFAIGDAVRVHIIDIDVEGRSMICGIAREEHASNQHSEKNKEEIKQAASDRAFTIGDIAGLKEMFQTREEVPPQVVTTPVEQQPSVVAEEIKEPVVDSQVFDLTTQFVPGPVAETVEPPKEIVEELPAVVVEEVNETVVDSNIVEPTTLLVPASDVEPNEPLKEIIEEQPSVHEAPEASVKHL